MRQRRGETVVLTFSQQGWGNLSNTLCIILLLAMQGATGAAVTPKQVCTKFVGCWQLARGLVYGAAAVQWRRRWRWPQ